MQEARTLKILSSSATGTVVPYSLMDIHETLRELGHDVFVADLAATEDYHTQVITMLDALVAFKPDMLVTIDHIGIIPHVLSVLPDTPVVLSWFFDNPHAFLRPDFKLIRDRLHLFVWDHSYIPQLHADGYPHVHYQPFASNPKVYYPCPMEYLYGVSFVGSFSDARAKVLTELTREGIEIHVFGDERWHGVSSGLLIYHGPADNRTEVPDIYRQSRINLNITSPQLIRALPVRLFDVLACEGFLITDDREDARTLFDPERELVVYRDIPHLIELIEYYNMHDAERDEIRRSGMQKVHDKYIFKAVIPDMIVKTMSSRDAPVFPPSDNNTRLRAMWLLTLSYLKHNCIDEVQKRLEMLLAVLPDVSALHELEEALGMVKSSQVPLGKVVWQRLYAPYKTNLPVDDNGFISLPLPKGA